MTGSAWHESPLIIKSRYTILEGAETLAFTSINGLDAWFFKGSLDPTKAVIPIEAIALEGDPTSTTEVAMGAMGYCSISLELYDSTTEEFQEYAYFYQPRFERINFNLDLTEFYANPTTTGVITNQALPDLEHKVYKSNSPAISLVFYNERRYAHI